MSDPCASIKSIYDGKTADNSGMLEAELKFDAAANSVADSGVSSDDDVSLSAASVLSTTATKDGIHGKRIPRLGATPYNTNIPTAMAWDPKSFADVSGRMSPASQASAISTTSLNTTQAAIDGDQGHGTTADAMSLRAKIQLLDHPDT